jgi:hypothetical protein
MFFVGIAEYLAHALMFLGLQLDTDMLGSPTLERSSCNITRFHAEAILFMFLYLKNATRRNQKWFSVLQEVHTSLL